MLAVGEVRTALLQNSVAVPPDVAEQLLQVRLDEQVRVADRPISHAVSPDTLTGVDCRLATVSNSRTRAVGTVASHVSLVGRRVLQGSSYAELVLGAAERRVPWSHYLTRPGVLEETGSKSGNKPGSKGGGKASWGDIRDGYLEQDPADTLNPGAIAERLLDQVQRNAALDRTPPFRAGRGMLRWVLEDAADGVPRAHFAVVSPALRTLRLALPAPELPAVVELCEDLARHDWLLTTLIELTEQAQYAADRPAELLATLRPAMAHLAHLWLPGARVDEALLPVVQGFDRRPGFTPQWDVLVNRIRDQIAVAVALLVERSAVAARI